MRETIWKLADVWETMKLLKRWEHFLASGTYCFLKCSQKLGKISGWWLSHPSEQYESQLGWLHPIYGKIKVMFQSPPTRSISIIMIFHILSIYYPYHQPDMVDFRYGEAGSCQALDIIGPCLWWLISWGRLAGSSSNRSFLGQVDTLRGVNMANTKKPERNSKKKRHFWLVSSPLKNIKVTWDDYSEYMGKWKMFQTANQI